MRVEVIKSAPRDRSRLLYLTGSLRVTVKSTSHLHIGSLQIQLKKEEPALREVLERLGFDRAVEKVKFEEVYTPFVLSAGAPTIPGSTIKGNVRSRVELSFRARKGKVRSCFAKSSAPLRTPPLTRTHGWRHWKIWGEVLKEDRGLPCNHTRGGPVCLVCDLFGAPGLKSLVNFSDFSGDNVKLTELNLEHEIRVLAAPPNSEFKGRVTFTNVRSEELGLLLIGMGIREASREGSEVLMGRFKYRGRIGGYTLGRVRYIVEEMKLNKLSKPIDVEGSTLNPGDSASGHRLDVLIGSLVNHALATYEEELKIVDEVKAVD